MQETSGREEATEILGHIATEALQRSGGNKHEIAVKRSRIAVSLKSGLSTSQAVPMHSESLVMCVFQQYMVNKHILFQHYSA